MQANVSGPSPLNLNPSGGKVPGKPVTAAAGYASLNVPAGAAPATPADGDIWPAGGRLDCRSRYGGVTKQLDN